MKTNRLSGFTVVELVVTIVAAGVIIPAVALALANIIGIDHRARDLTLASSVAQTETETLRSVGYNSLSHGTTSFTSQLPAAMGNPKSANYTISTPETGVKQIDITISYSDYGASHTFTYRTYISELGVGQ